eukprot:290801-Chlamydomonas_euryale.AAC.1
MSRRSSSGSTNSADVPICAASDGQDDDAPTTWSDAAGMKGSAWRSSCKLARRSACSAALVHAAAEVRSWCAARLRSTA